MKIKPNLTAELILFIAIVLSSSIFSGCKKKKNDSTENSTYYYKATIDGKEYAQTATDANGYEAGSAMGGVDDVTLSAVISPKDYQYEHGKTYMDVTKGILHNYLSITDQQFFQFFTPGTYNFTSGPSYDPYKNGDGFTVTWFDENGEEWDTFSGTGDQTESTMKIISEQDEQSQLNYTIRVKVQFNCKLYNYNTGEMKQLTNGELVGVFSEIP
ncbi:MAG: hypothetical protein ACTHJN_17490 [Ginsengibacter sp.]